MLQLNLKSRLTNTTGLVKVQNGILICLDQREVTLHVLLHIRNAFDTVDYEIMLEILKSNFAVSGSASLFDREQLPTTARKLLGTNPISFLCVKII